MQRNMPRKDLYEKIITQSKNYWLQTYLKKWKEINESDELKFKAIDVRGGIAYSTAIQLSDGLHQESVKCTSKIFELLATETQKTFELLMNEPESKIKSLKDLSKVKANIYVVDVGRAYRTLSDAEYPEDQIQKMKIMDLVVLDAILFEAQSSVLEESFNNLITTIAMDSNELWSEGVESAEFSSKIREKIENEFAKIALGINKNNIDESISQLTQLDQTSIDELGTIIDELNAQLDSVHLEMKNLTWSKGAAELTAELERLVFLSRHVNTIVDHYNIPLLKHKTNKVLEKAPELMEAEKEFNFNVACNSLKAATVISDTDTQLIKDLKTSGQKVLQEVLKLKSSDGISLEELPTYTGSLQGTAALISATANPKSKPEVISQMLKDKINKPLNKVPELMEAEKEFNFNVACNSLNAATVISDTDTQLIKDLKTSGQKVLQEVLKLKSSDGISLEELPTYTGSLQGTAALISATANPKSKPKPEVISQMLKDKINKPLNKVPELMEAEREFNFNVACNSLNAATVINDSDAESIKNLKSSGQKVLQEALDLQKTGKLSSDELPTYTEYVTDTTALVRTTANPESKPEVITKEFDKHCENINKLIGDKKPKLKQHDRFTGAMVAVAGAVVVALSLAFIGVTLGWGMPVGAIGIGLGIGLSVAGLAVGGAGAAVTGYGATIWGINKLTPKEQMTLEMENVAEKANMAKPKKI